MYAVLGNYFTPWLVLKEQYGQGCPKFGFLHLTQPSDIILAGFVLQNVSHVTPWHVPIPSVSRCKAINIVGCNAAQIASDALKWKKKAEIPNSPKSNCHLLEPQCSRWDPREMWGRALHRTLKHHLLRGEPGTARTERMHDTPLGHVPYSAVQTSPMRLAQKRLTGVI